MAEYCTMERCAVSAVNVTPQKRRRPGSLVALSNIRTQENKTFSELFLQEKQTYTKHVPVKYILEVEEGRPGINAHTRVRSRALFQPVFGRFASPELVEKGFFVANS